MTRAALTVAIAIIVVVLPASVVHADHDKYQFKWPYRPEGNHPTTGWPYQAHHAGADAWDFDVGGGSVNGKIVSSAEGTVMYATSEYDPDTCNPNDDFGFGNNVKVVAPVAGPDISMTYAHLSSVSVTQGSRVLQGDQIGIEGKTGHTEGSEPPGWVHPEGFIGCGTHLHWEFAQTPGRPDYIDGDYVGGAPPAGGPSTNSIVGASNAPGAAIQQKYVDIGPPVGPWGIVGWTADWTGTQSGCTVTPFCRLYVHYAPLPEAGHWGSVQTFRQHPGTPVFNDNSVMVGRWAVNDAYWVEEGFFEAWVDGWAGVGLPLADAVGSGGPGCSAQVGCVRYQRFHSGYIWEHVTLGVQAPVICPDVAPYYPNQDDAVTINDVAAVASRFLIAADPGPPFSSWSDSFYDLTGDRAVTITDVSKVAAHYLGVCVPS